MKTSKYFSEAEFRKCTPPCSIEDMEQDSLDLMDKMREDAGIPFVVNSAYRSVAYEKSKGRAGTSAHTFGVAWDIRCNTDKNRWKIVNSAIRNGVKRIGIAKTYIHLDTSLSHTQEVVWLY